MARVLILFTEESIDSDTARPEALQQLLQSTAPDLSVDVATFQDVVFSLAPNNVSVYIPHLGRDIAEYGAVYLRRIEQYSNEAVAVGKYCLAKHVPVFDEEIALRPGSTSKLTQYIQLALEGLPIPTTIYSITGGRLLDSLAHPQHGLAFPIILKAINGSRGEDNYYVETIQQARDLIAEHHSVFFLAQQFIPNSSDYRIWVCGGKLGPILARTRVTGHMNNTSQGAQATLVEDPSKLPAKVLEDSIRASKLLYRTIAGVDIVFANDDIHGAYFILEVNRNPQIEGTQFEDLKANALAEYFLSVVKDTSK